MRADSVDVYCNPVNYLYLLPYIAHWPNLHVHCLHEDQYENEDRAEEFKIESFVSMVHSCCSIAVPFNGIDEQTKFEPMLIEKWPMVQAFALDDIVGGGFFTMKYKVVDISCELHDIYQHLDPVAVELLVSEQLPQFEKQWTSMYDVIDLHIRNNERELTEGCVGEPLKTYYWHGRNKKDETTPGITSCRQPFVLFGTNTSRSILSSSRRIGIGSDATVENTGVATGTAQHMICQAVCPQGPLFCVRTYFLNTELATLSDNSDITGKFDLRLLKQVYAACINAVTSAIEVYSRTLDPIKAEEEARQVLLKSCIESNTHISEDHLSDRKLVDFVLEAVDSRNRFVALSDDAGCRLLTKTVTVTVYDIVSLHHVNKTLGSVCYGEAFISSNIHVSLTDDVQSMDASHVVLTQHIPQCLSWPVSKEERTRFAEWRRQIATSIERQSTTNADDNNDQSAQPNLQLTAPLGKFLCKSDTAVVIAGLAKVYDGELTLWERGFTYLHIHHGVLILPMSHVEAISIYDGGSPSAVALLVIQFTDKARSGIPFHLQSPEGVLVLSFAPKTCFYQLFFREVVSTWRSFEHAKITTLTELPEKLTRIHQQLQCEHQLLTAVAAGRSSFKKAKVQLPNLHEFLIHFAVSSVTTEPVPISHLPAMMGKPCEPQTTDSSETMVVNVVSGVPGCHQGALCTALTRMSHDDAAWMLVSCDATASPAIVQGALVERHEAGVRRIILHSSSFMDIVDMVQSVLCHSDSTFSKHIKIGAVTICVSPHNAYLSDHYTWPKLLDQCAHGWVNNIVITECTDSKDSELDNLQQLLRAVNSNVAFLLAENGEITRTPDISLVLSQTAFNEPSLLRARHLSRPGWWHGRSVCSRGYPMVEMVAILFSRPLQRSNLINEIKVLSKEHHRPYSRKFFLLNGTVNFTDYPDEWYELRACVLSGDVHLTPTQQVACPGVTFCGFRLVDDQLRDWLRACAPKKSERKSHRTRDSLTSSEVQMVHKENHLKPTPEGWFYNGSHFVSLIGEKSYTHPDLELFLLSYLDDLNKAVDVYNANVDCITYHDLFE